MDKVNAQSANDCALSLFKMNDFRPLNPRPKPAVVLYQFLGSSTLLRVIHVIRDDRFLTCRARPDFVEFYT